MTTFFLMNDMGDRKAKFLSCLTDKAEGNIFMESIRLMLELGKSS